MEKILRSVGIETFIKYFEVFQDNKDSHSNKEILEAFNDSGEQWTDNSKSTKASKGKKIFKENLEMLALEYTINSDRLDEDILLKAENLYSKLKQNDFSELLEEISDIEKSDIEDSIKNTIVKVRIGQSKYRSALIEYWKGCSITNCKELSVLVSSHIKPYHQCKKEEKFDIYNGLLLTPNYDKLFDKALISFDDEGKILISQSLKDEDLKLLGVSKDASIRKDKLTDKHLHYLSKHREIFYENKENIEIQ